MEEKTKNQIYPRMVCQGCDHIYQLDFDPRRKYCKKAWGGGISQVVRVGMKRLMESKCPKCGYEHSKCFEEMEKIYQTNISV